MSNKDVDLSLKKEIKVSAETIVTASHFTGTPLKELIDAFRIAGIKTESKRKCLSVQKMVSSFGTISNKDEKSPNPFFTSFTSSTMDDIMIEPYVLLFSKALDFISSIVVFIFFILLSEERSLKKSTREGKKLSFG
jgi:hypothetical protein